MSDNSACSTLVHLLSNVDQCPETLSAQQACLDVANANSHLGRGERGNR